MRTLFAPALLLTLHLLPPAVAWSGGSRNGLWFASGVLIAAATVAFVRQGGLSRRVAACVFNLLIAFANVLLAISFRVQGAGFNVEFFAHANWETLVFVAVALRPVLWAALAYFLLILGCLFLVPKAAAPRPRTKLIAATTVAGLALSAPAWSFGWHIAGIVADVQSALWVPKPVLRLAPTAPPQARSLLLIFAESLEAAYSRADIFGEDLTPRLTALAASGKQFTDMRQVSLTAWSTGAMAAAQCARPLSADGLLPDRPQGLPIGQDLLRNIARGVAPEMEGATCLGDLLTAYGYRTVLMIGTVIDFGGIDAFHAKHSFVERLGFDTLRHGTSEAGLTKWGSNLQHWMIQDETLFALARTKIDELAQNAEPFALVLNTMDTHGPSGFPSPRCGKSRGMIDAVRCADLLIAEFIEEVGDAHPNLVVALLTDHLIGGGADKEVLGLLVPHPKERRLRFVVWGPDLAPGVVGHPGTHFDVMPTLMDVLGLSDWTEHYLGASLLRFESPWFSHDRPLSLRVVHELPSIQLQAGDEVRFEPDGPVVDLDGRRLLATSKGLNLRDAVFAIRLDDAGTGIDFHTFDDSSGESVVHEVEQWADGDALVGVSTNRTFNAFHRGASGIERLSADTVDTMYFAGIHGAETFMTGPLATRKVIRFPSVGPDRARK